MKKFKKIQSNLLSGRSVSVLGPVMYSGWLKNIFASIPSILKDGDLRSVDKIMGMTAKKFHYRGSTFLFTSISL